ncbi:transposase [Streptomyces sp. NBC_01142]|uniref:transposase n=1 Tax=Streptomyces sp. NBC_01142 TaxID=2975865 RepID=UPI00225B6685|nr:transposase [Streptomyces sp. NBC_01142]MCX4826218.1 transposase [Streptomyces sp. NBC_01142]
MSEQDFIALVDSLHQLARAAILLVLDRLNTHVARGMRDLVAERAWLTMFLLPAYPPDLNPAEDVRAHVSEGLANLIVMARPARNPPPKPAQTP